MQALTQLPSSSVGPPSTRCSISSWRRNCGVILIYVAAKALGQRAQRQITFQTSQRERPFDGIRLRGGRSRCFIGRQFTNNPSPFDTIFDRHRPGKLRSCASSRKTQDLFGTRCYNLGIVPEIAHYEVRRSLIRDCVVKNPRIETPHREGAAAHAPPCGTILSLRRGGRTHSLKVAERGLLNFCLSASHIAKGSFFAAVPSRSLHPDLDHLAGLDFVGFGLVVGGR